MDPLSTNGATLTKEATESMAPLIRIVCWFLVSISGLFLSLRLYCKYLQSRGLWWDDHVLVMAWVCSPTPPPFPQHTNLTSPPQLALVADTIITTINLDLGFGLHLSAIPPPAVPTITLLSNVSTSLAFLGAVWSKTSFGMTLLRITDGKTRAIVWFVMVSMNVAVSASIVVSWVQCDPLPKGWDKGIAARGRCWDPRVNVYCMVFAAGECTWSPFPELTVDPASVLWRHGHRPRPAPLANHLEAADEAERKDWRRPGHEHGCVVSGHPFRRVQQTLTSSCVLAAPAVRPLSRAPRSRSCWAATLPVRVPLFPGTAIIPRPASPQVCQVLTRHRLGVRPRNLGRRRGGHHHLRRIRAPAAGAHPRGTQPDTAALRIHRPGRRRWWRWWWWWWCRVRTRRRPRLPQEQRWGLVPRQGTPSMDARLFQGQLPRGGV